MKKLLLTISMLCGACLAFGQDDLMKELEQNQQNDTDYAFQTFKGTRLINGHTIETKANGTLEFIFMHRFGTMNSGLYEMFGLDEADVRLGLDYGVTDNMSISITRNSYDDDKSMDGYVKYKVLRQSKGAVNFPVSITFLGGLAYKVAPKKELAPEGFATIDRLAYVSQLLIARKFTTKFSFQLMPSFIHKNAAVQATEHNDQFALGMGGRIKLTKSVALTSEYYHRFNVHENNRNFNPVGIGIDIETGGHVFQLIMTNTRRLTERAFITETEGDIGKGDILLGFNVTRTFQLKHKK